MVHEAWEAKRGMPGDSLIGLYPQWIANCRESARWLRSGKEYEDFMRTRAPTATMLSLQEREKEALRFEAEAEKYAAWLARAEKADA